MANQWFRFYSDALHDPKVQSLGGVDFKIWVNILCLACKNDGKLPRLSDISFAIRLPISRTKSKLLFLKARGLLDIAEGTTDCFIPHSWNKRQYKSDSSTERVKRFRNVTVTPPDTDTDTDTEQKEKDNTIVLSKKPIEKLKRATRLPENWELEQEEGDWAEAQGLKYEEVKLQEAKFKDYWIGSGKTKADWKATWRNWIRTTIEGKYKNGLR